MPEYDPCELLKIDGQFPLDHSKLFSLPKHLFFLGGTGTGKTYAVCKLLESWAPLVGQIIWITPRESYESNEALLNGLVSKASLSSSRTG